MKKTLYLMRHGQTLFNVRRKIQGACDSPLTELGIQQAGIASAYFDDIDLDHAYSSTAERASDTLEIVTNELMPYQRLKGLKEMHFGTFEGESEDLNPKDKSTFFVQYGGGWSVLAPKSWNRMIIKTCSPFPMPAPASTSCAHGRIRMK